MDKTVPSKQVKLNAHIEHIERDHAVFDGDAVGINTNLLAAAKAYVDVVAWNDAEKDRRVGRCQIAERRRQ